MSLHRLNTIDLKNSGSLSPIGQGIVWTTSSTPEPPPVTRTTPLCSPTRALHGSSPFRLIPDVGRDRPLLTTFPFFGFSTAKKDKKDKKQQEGGRKKRGADLERSQALASNGPRTPLVFTRSANYIPRLLLRFDGVFSILTSSLHFALLLLSWYYVVCSLCPVTLDIPGTRRSSVHLTPARSPLHSWTPPYWELTLLFFLEISYASCFNARVVHNERRC